MLSSLSMLCFGMYTRAGYEISSREALVKKPLTILALLAGFALSESTAEAGNADSYYYSDDAAMAAGAVVATIPVAAIVLVAQRGIVAGLTAGAVKG